MNRRDDTVGDDYWDSVIEPRGSLVQLNLGEIWRYRDLLYLFTCREVGSF